MGEERRLRSKWTERKERYERLQRLQYAREQHAVRLRERQLRLDREANDRRLLSEASAGKSGGRLDDAGSRRQIRQLRLHLDPRLISPSRAQERLIRARRRARRLNRSAYSTPGATYAGRAIFSARRTNSARLTGRLDGVQRRMATTAKIGQKYARKTTKTARELQEREINRAEGEL